MRRKAYGLDLVAMLKRKPLLQAALLQLPVVQAKLHNELQNKHESPFEAQRRLEQQHEKQTKMWFCSVFANQDRVHGIELDWERVNQLKAGGQLWMKGDYDLVALLRQQYEAFVESAFTRSEDK